MRPAGLRTSPDDPPVPRIFSSSDRGPSVEHKLHDDQFLRANFRTGRCYSVLDLLARTVVVPVAARSILKT